MPHKIAGNLIARITANRAFSHGLGQKPTYGIAENSAKKGFKVETDTKAISVRTVDQLPVGISVGHNPSLAALCC
jgi:hypothetical protein